MILYHPQTERIELIWKGSKQNWMPFKENARGIATATPG